MSIEKYLEEMKSIQHCFLEFIEDDENCEEKFQNLYCILQNNEIQGNKHSLRLFLHHISSVCANHHRFSKFFSKIEKVLQIFKDDIKNFYLNSEIFSIFKRDKRILLFLFEENMLTFDEYVARTIIGAKYVCRKYPQYFSPEIAPFIGKKWFPKCNPDSQYNQNEWLEEIKKDIPDNFHELRKIGENESYICKLIRDDNAKDFVTHMCKSNFSINMRIDLSIYETNTFLIKKVNESKSKKSISLIEYAAFFGSIQIIRYLKDNGAEFTPSLWIYAIHSQNAEFIHFLEDCHIEPTLIVHKDILTSVEEKSYVGCFNESIKCNHNAIADYFFNNYLQSDQASDETFTQSLKYYNFGLLQKEYVNKSSFCRLCAQDYYLFVNNLLVSADINVNAKIIQNNIFQ